MEKEIKEIINISNELYCKLNTQEVFNDINIIDYIFPNHDGINAEHGCDILQLRQSLYSLLSASDCLIDKLSRIIDNLDV